MELTSGQRFVFKATKSNRIKFDTINRYIFASTFVADKKVLDAACGSGFGSFMYAQEAKEVWGVDNSAETIDYAKKNFTRDNIKFINDDLITIMELPEKFFDVIVSFHTIEQTGDPDKFLDNLNNSLKDDGIIILSTQNKKIVSPFSKNTALDVNQYDFYKNDLENLFKEKFSVTWYGQRCTFKPFANLLVRRLIRVIEKIFRVNFKLYGARESDDIKQLTWWREPKEFIVTLKKK